MLSTIHVDFADGRGYLKASWNTAIGASYNAVGTKRLKIKITFTDASKMECFVDFNVLKVQVAARFANPADLE